MFMKYLQFDVFLDEQYQQNVWHLLCKYDHSFIPALSSRQSTSQSNLALNNPSKAQPIDYFQNILKQSIFLAVNDDNKVIGFMSYKPSYISEDLQDNIDTIYITTIIVDEAYRGNGVTSTFYHLIEELAHAAKKPIMTRTWSTNTAHISVLKKIGMMEIKRLTDARGKGIDTVYYRKPIGG